MKKINYLRTFLFIIVLLNFMIKTYSQDDYYPFPQTDAKWTILHTNMFQEDFWEIREYKTGDTITIENNLYRLLVYSCIENQYYAFREENKQIFFYIPSIGEVLVYDFNLKVGDTIFYYIDFYRDYKFGDFKCKSCGDLITRDDENTHFKVVKSIDKVILADGTERRRFSLYEWYDEYVDDIWIEGVGSIEGLLNPIINLSAPCGDEYHFTCLRENQEVIYHTPKCTDCLCGHLNVPAIAKFDISTYPNPAFSTVTIEANNFNKVEVYNIFGQLLHTAKNQIVDVSYFNAGVYFFKIFDTENNSVVKRVMKM